MKKNNLTNQKLISAMLVGISAMMSISAPITAYAQDGEDNSSELENEEMLVQEEQQQEAVTAEAQEDAQDVLDAIETAKEEAEEVAEVPVQALEVGEVAKEAVEDVVTEADTTNDLGFLDAAEDKIEDVQSDLIVAETENDKADEEAFTAVDNANSAFETAQEIVEEVSDANDTVTDLIDKIEDAESPEEAQEICDAIVGRINEAAENVELKKELFETFSSQYESAKGRLEVAEQNYINALNDASQDVELAKKELDKAQTSADALETAVEIAKAELEKESDAAKNINESEETLKPDWNVQRQYMYSVITSYYIPQVVDSGATNIKVEKYQKGFDQQDYNYNIITYTDSNGDKQTLFFNYDREDKTITNNRYGNLGGSNDIVIYEKSQEEIGANDYLNKYYKGSNFSQSELRNKANNGDFDVFAYDYNGTTQYMVREELDNALEAGTITIGDEGNLFIGDEQIHEVVQNQNSKAKGGEYAVDTKNDENFKNFCDNANNHLEKIEAYDIAVENAQNAVEDAKEKADILADTIDNLKENRTNRVVKAAEVLGVEDIATFLGIETTAQEASSLNNMTINQAIKFLDKKLDQAKGMVEEAEADLETLKSKEADGKAKLDAVIEKYTTTDDDQEGDGQGQTQQGEEQQVEGQQQGNEQSQTQQGEEQQVEGQQQGNDQSQIQQNEDQQGNNQSQNKVSQVEEVSQGQKQEEIKDVVENTIIVPIIVNIDDSLVPEAAAPVETKSDTVIGESKGVEPEVTITKVVNQISEIVSKIVDPEKLVVEPASNKINSENTVSEITGNVSNSDNNIPEAKVSTIQNSDIFTVPENIVTNNDSLFVPANINVITAEAENNISVNNVTENVTSENNTVANNTTENITSEDNIVANNTTENITSENNIVANNTTDSITLENDILVNNITERITSENNSVENITTENSIIVNITGDDVQIDNQISEANNDIDDAQGSNSQENDDDYNVEQEYSPSIAEIIAGDIMEEQEQQQNLNQYQYQNQDAYATGGEQVFTDRNGVTEDIQDTSEDIQQVANIIDEASPTTAKIPTTNNKKKIATTKEIKDLETPLSSNPLESKEEKTSWWWLLIIALFGVAGEEMYRKYKEREKK